jgi:hypothetical protein
MMGGDMVIKPDAENSDSSCVSQLMPLPAMLKI